MSHQELHSQLSPWHSCPRYRSTHRALGVSGTAGGRGCTIRVNRPPAAPKCPRQRLRPRRSRWERASEDGTRGRHPTASPRGPPLIGEPLSLPQEVEEEHDEEDDDVDSDDDVPDLDDGGSEPALRMGSAPLLLQALPDPSRQPSACLGAGLCLLHGRDGVLTLRPRCLRSRRR